jgi:ubiquinone biosynthesis protein
MRPIPFYISRTAATLLLTSVFGIRFALTFLRRSSDGPRLLRTYLERLGAAFVKLGQVLAMRYDLLPAAYCEELSVLLDRLAPSPSAVIVRTIELDLGKPVAELFRTFDPEPLSSASVAQVHAITLLNGQRAVVKVKHPGVDARYRVDLANLRIVMRLASYLGLLGRVDVEALLRELTRLSEEELDFRHEARNIYVLHDLMSADGVDHKAPAVYLALSGRSVITMERLDGVWARELLSAVERRDLPLLDQWKQRGITPERTASLLLRSVLEQCFTHRIFHADPHAGNIVVMDGGTLGYVDFGLVGWLDEKLWAQQFALNQALAEGNIHRAWEAILDMLEPLPARDLSGFEMDVKALLMDWLFATRVPGTSLAERSSATLFLRLFAMVRQCGLNMSPATLRLIRALMTSDIVTLRLDPSLDRIVELRAYFEDRLKAELQRELPGRLTADSARQAMLGLLTSVRTFQGVVDATRKRLPELGRRYRQEPTSYERASEAMLRCVRALAGAAILAIAVGRWAAMPFFPESYWARAAASLGGWSWGAAVAAMLILVTSGAALRRDRARR